MLTSKPQQLIKKILQWTIISSEHISHKIKKYNYLKYLTDLPH